MCPSRQVHRDTAPRCLSGTRGRTSEPLQGLSSRSMRQAPRRSEVSLASLPSGSHQTKVLLQPLPVGVVVALEQIRVQAEARRTEWQLRFEEKHQRVVEELWLELRRPPALVRFRVRTVARHAVVQARTARTEVVSLADVLPGNQPEKLARDVSVERRWTEGVFSHGPSWRETSKLHVRCAGHRRRRREHTVDRRIRMIEGHRVDALKLVEVVLERQVVATPGDDVEWRVIDFSFPHPAAELGHETEVTLAIFEACNGSLKVARVREAEGPDGAEVG